MQAVEEQYKYDKCGRMAFHPDFHTKHQQVLTLSEKEYLCKYWEVDDMRTMAFALDRTESSLASTVCRLKKQGLFDYYKNLNKYW
ncbi:hypothetical protein HNQ94_000434 [Salirhabdus euzebyi]|uniref:DNA-entry nuclease n=1 Tax=Salirhabdus euzebyi TaxID=394506 RepID=A0A841Q1E9_9BACI|nr:DNA-entry nuclease [Salirhabdus euzebyi]MBB6452013.1 hypothetical protein [Salirhabdus euzebyi]